ncbi:GTPase family protein protein, putative [Babesia bigemina]|uniref:GTPase family protein protein, putative n=1 Tax=Babesia bigemina TaxID=5866 RepID=A0A061D7H3_BABBI|nr:GTPase family protein protein, putative [Babesia bigemina]CDR96656.1 GTPase family protein protein, putative [Babesia bigemina]|eukprot:XP_012768842.1 GTPase family protein protein, putative [Babesia bigemina]
MRQFRLLASPKVTYTGPGRKVADRIKEQFSVQNDFQVRQVRKALKRYKRTEERRLLAKRRNIVLSERNVDKSKHRNPADKRAFKIVSKYEVHENPYTHFLRPLEKRTEKNPLGKATVKPVRMGIPLDTAAGLYEGASPVAQRPSGTPQVSTLQFIGSYIHTSTLPSLYLPEICLVGRSNVGKSSFINTLMTYIKTRRKSCDMAYVSKTPGYTKCINIFKAVDVKGRDVLSITDLPGYGYVKIKNRETVRAMDSALRAYLQRRNELKLILFLIDGSIEPQESDTAIHEMLKALGIPYLMVCTKMDKVAQNQVPGQILLFRQVYDVKSPLPVAYSKFGGADLGGIWRAIFDACDDKFDPANLQISDAYQSLKDADFEKYVQSQSMVSTKDLKKLIYKNFDLLPQSVQSADIDRMSKDEMLDVLRLAAERSDAIRSKPIDLLEYKKKHSKM